jgi:hypothetical protein
MQDRNPGRYDSGYPFSDGFLEGFSITSISSLHLGQRVARAALATSASNEDTPFDKIGNVAQCRARYLP